MKNFICLFILTCSFFSNTNAQLAPGSIAPDFVTTDINGNEHHLYDILNEGKVVIMDIFATWCGPCWGYHQQHVLANFYDTYGPEGTNEAFVIAVEGDSGTDVQCLYGQAGCNDVSIGDWTIGIPYPIADDRQIAVDYNLGFYPTIYVIFPNRVTYEIGQLPLNELVRWKDQSPSLSPGINPVFLNYNGFNGSVCNQLWIDAPNFLLSNLGEETITSADITLTNNGSVIYDESWTGEAVPYSIIESVTIPTQIITDNTVIESHITNINGDASESISRKSEITLNTSSWIEVSVQTDQFSFLDENRYEIIDEGGNVIVSENLFIPNESVQRSHIMPATGCYEFVIYDGGSDGIDGELTVRDGDGNLIYFNDGFTSRDMNSFNVGIVSSNEDIETNQVFSISPNPVADYISIDLSGINTEFDLLVTNISGQGILKQKHDGKTKSNLKVDFTEQLDGIYLLTIKTSDQIYTKRVIKQ